MPVYESRIRKSGKFVHQENEGTIFWVYDDSYLKELQSVFPELSAGYQHSPDKEARKGLLSLAQDGKLICIQMVQDGEITAEVIWGDKPTKEELGPVRRQRPLRAFLRLPSGKLCVEGANIPRLYGVGWPKHKTDLVKVEPGDYFLDVYFLNYDKMEELELGDESDEDEHLPEFILSLVKDGNSESIKKHHVTLWRA